jgi:hypothetical protein
MNGSGQPRSPAIAKELLALSTTTNVTTLCVFDLWGCSGNINIWTQKRSCNAFPYSWAQRLLSHRFRF